MGGLLYKRSIDINSFIKVHVPTVGEIYDREDEYYSLVLSWTAMPYDMMVQLDDIGMKFTDINDYDLFLLMWNSLRERDMTLLFGDLDLSKAVTIMNEETHEYVIADAETGLMIDRGLHTQIADAFRRILSLEKNDKRPGNDEAYKYLVERERKKQRRRARKKEPESQMENNIVALVNTEQFSYTFDTVRDMTIYQFNASLQQIAHKINYDNTMHGYFAGTVKFDKIAPEDRTWIRSVKKH